MSDTCPQLEIFEPGSMDKHEIAYPMDERDWDVFRGLDGSPKSATWRPIRVRVGEADEDSPGMYSDMPWLSHWALVLRESAVAALSDLLKGQGELLPLRDESNQPLFVLNARTVDALDLERSKLRYLLNGAQFVGVTEHVFRKRALEGVHVFRLPVNRVTYVSREFVERVRRAGLTGLVFTQVWSEATGPVCPDLA